MDLNLNARAIEKLVDYAASGIGSVAGSMLATWQAKRETRARIIEAEGNAQTLLIQAEAQSKARNILLSQDTGVTGELNISDKVDQRILFQERKRQFNIESVVKKAAIQLGDKQVDDREPDHDWIARFFNDVQDVSSENMQELWAKILAGEVEQGGSSSIRTLSILKNIDRATAELFANFCSACIYFRLDRSPNDARVPSLGRNAANNSLRDYGFDFQALNRLNEHGLIISDYNSWIDAQYCQEFDLGGESVFLDIPFTFQGRFWKLTSNSQMKNKKHKIRVNGVALTSSGVELSRVIDLVPMEKFTQDLISYFQKNGLKMSEVSKLIPQPRN